MKDINKILEKALDAIIFGVPHPCNIKIPVYLSFYINYSGLSTLAKKQGDLTSP
jgi:hypothetical protein